MSYISELSTLMQDGCSAKCYGTEAEIGLQQMISKDVDVLAKGIACISVGCAPSLSSLALVLAFAYCSTSFVCDLHASLQDRRG